MWFWILSDLSVCVSSFFFVRFITSLVWFSWSRTALWWSSAAQNTCNVVWICWCCDVEHEIGQETSVLRLPRQGFTLEWLLLLIVSKIIGRSSCKALMQVLHLFTVLPSLQVCSLFWFSMCRCQCEKWLMLPDHYAITAHKMTWDGKKHRHDMLKQWHPKKPYVIS